MKLNSAIVISGGVSVVGIVALVLFLPETYSSAGALSIPTSAVIVGAVLAIAVQPLLAIIDDMAGIDLLVFYNMFLSSGRFLLATIFLIAGMTWGAYLVVSWMLVGLAMGYFIGALHNSGWLVISVVVTSILGAIAGDVTGVGLLFGAILGILLGDALFETSGIIHWRIIAKENCTAFDMLY